MEIKENVLLEQLEEIFDENHQNHICEKTCIFKNNFLKIVAEQDGLALGYTVLRFGNDFIEVEELPLQMEIEEKSIYIWNCVTRKGHENQGVMSAIFEYFLQKFSDYNIYSIVDKDNTASIKIHKKFGFIFTKEFEKVHIGKHTHFYLTKKGAQMKPIIGLVAKHRDEERKRPLTYTCDEMMGAVVANGGIAIGILPTTREIIFIDQDNESEIYNKIEQLFTKQEKEDMIKQINLCDGIILSGGGASDAYEVWIAKYCYENDIPIMGICAGHNNIVRAVGGATKKVNNPEFHRQSEDYVHDVSVNPNSQFYNFVLKEKFKVNSRHRNTIDDCKQLFASAYDEDGNIEVCEASDKKCYLGIRFHPESLYQMDETHNRIFEEFIKICKKG